MYSALIAQQILDPTQVVSPRERNPYVKRMADYNYDAYQPQNSEYWDRSFKANLEVESHASYAHLLLYGARKRMKWRNTSDPDTPILSNRGPADGKPDRNSYTTRRDGTWAGFVVFADNSVRWFETMTPENVLCEPFTDPPSDPVPDNIFTAEFHDRWPKAPLGSNDIYLTFTLEMLDEPPMGRPIVQHD